MKTSTRQPVVSSRSSLSFRIRSYAQRLAPRAILAGSIAALLASPSAQATNGTWLNTGATNGNWTTTSNWVGGTVPGSTAAITGTNANADIATFNTAVGTYGTSGNPILIDSASENIAGITFTGSSIGSYFIGTTGGNSLYLSSGGSIAMGGNGVVGLTINAPLVIEGASGTYTLQNDWNSTSSLMTVNGQISGGNAGATTLTLTGTQSGSAFNAVNGNVIDGLATSLAINKSGGGTWILAGANTYTGGTTVSLGTLIAQDGATAAPGANNFIKGLSTGTVALSGGTLNLRANGSGSTQTIITGDGTTGNNVTVSGDATINVDRLSGTNSGSTIQFNNLSIGANTLTVTNGNTYGLQFAGTTTLTGNATIATSGGNTTLTGAVGGNFSLTKNSSNTLVLTSAANSYTGGTILNQGMLYYNGTATSGTPFGTGSISLVQANGAASNSSNNGTSTSATTLLSINPQGSGSAIALTGGTAAGSTFSFAGGSYLSLNKGTQTSLSYTFGPGSGTVLNRVGRGTLGISGSAYNVAPGSNSLATMDKFLISGTAPTVTNGMVDPYILNEQFGTSGAATFVTYDATNGFTPVTYDLTNTFAASDNTKKVLLTSVTTLASSASAYALNVNGALTINSGQTLTLGDGTHAAGLIVGAAISGGTIDFGASEGVLYATSANPTISSVIAGTNGITKTQYVGTNGSLTLSGLNTYTGTTTVNNGSLTFSNAGNQSHGALDGIGTVVNAAGSGQLNFTQAASTTYNIGTITNNTTTGATGALTLNAALNSVTTIATVNGASGSQVIFGGDGTGSTTIANVLGTAGQTVFVNSGTVTLATGRNTASNLNVSGGTLTVASTTDRLSMIGSAAGQSLTISGGQLLIPSSTQYGLRLNGDNGTNSAGTLNNIFTGSQAGGTLTINKGGSNLSFSLGSSTAETSTWTQSGGSANILGGGLDGRIDLGADTAGVGKTTFNLSGGKLLVSGQIAGIQGTAARQAFVWTGGTLATSLYIATNLTSADGAAYSGNVGTLTNAGGMLAPGDIGTAGRTTITGNYNVTSANAVLAIDLGGTTAATTFQGTAAQYDNLSVTGATTLGGRLNFNLTNSYTPLAATNHNIIVGTTAGATGTFTNQVVATSGNSRVVGADGLSSFLIATNTTGSTATLGGLTSVAARTTALGGYQATNTYNAATSGTWDAGSAASWTYFDPGSSSGASGAIAQFADGASTGTGANTLTLNSTRNIQGIQFSSAVAGHNYTINNGGSGVIILDNTSNGASATIGGMSASGNMNAINVPITLASNLVASVTNAANTLTLGGVISGSGKSFTKTGAGTVVLTGASTFDGGTIVNAGTLNLGVSNALSSTGAVTLNGGTLASAATFSQTLGTLSLTASSTLDLGTGGIFSFANSSGQTWTGALSIVGTLTNSSSVRFGTSSGGLTSGQLSVITFNNAAVGIDSNGYLVSSIPEPSTYAALAGLGILGYVAVRRRRAA